jgi:hypothetical protein
MVGPAHPLPAIAAKPAPGKSRSSATASRVEAQACQTVPLEKPEMSERTGIILLSFFSPMLIPLTALFATLSSVFRSRSVLQLENLALRQFSCEESRLSEGKLKTHSDRPVAGVRHFRTGREWHEFNR